MLVIYLALFLGAICLQETESYPEKKIYDLNNAPMLFAKFILDYDRHYTDDEDFFVHYAAFKHSLRIINAVNSDPNATWTADINMFADYTEEELRRINRAKAISPFSTA